MGAHVEMITGIIRAGNSFKNFGDPFEFSATVLIKDNEAFIMGASGKFNKTIFLEIKNVLIELGIKKAHWERVRTNKKRITTKTGV